MQDTDLNKYRGYLTLLANQQVRAYKLLRIDADDLVQETLRRALQARDQFEGNDSQSLAAWLRAILTNLIRDTLRKLRRHCDEQQLTSDLELSSIRLDQWLKCGELTPRRRLLRDESLLLLTNSMLTLPTDQRLAIELRYIQGYSIQKVAESMGRSTGSVGGLLQRGLASLRERMKD